MGDGLKSIRELLQTKYVIPAHQRDYVWTSRGDTGMVVEFWNDLKAYYENKEDGSSRYLFGSMIVYNAGQRCYVIDGQQRLTTIIIYLIAARDMLKEIATKNGEIVCDDADNDCSDIKSLIGRTADDPHRDDLELTVASANQEFFRDYLMKTKRPFPNKLSNAQKNMKEAYELFKKGLREKVLGEAEDYQHTSEERRLVGEITNTLLDDFKVFYVESMNLKEAYLAFGTLNYRGSSLTQADLLKNFLFSQCNPDGNDNHIEKDWDQMIADLGNAANMSKFIRYYWVSSHSSVSNNVLFHKISKEYDTPVKVNSFVKDLKKFSKLFAYCLDPDTRTDVIRNNEVTEILNNFKTMNFEIFVPLVLALFAENSTIIMKERIAILRKLESFAFRNITIIGQKTGPLWSKIVLASNEIRNDFKHYSYENILKHFEDIYANDEAFKQALLKKVYKDNELPKMILRRIYSDDELKTSSNIELEHILPRSKSNIQRNWKQFTYEEHKEYRFHIGNMTLLTPSDNRGCSDNSFEDKKEKVYSRSKLHENIELSKMDSWTKERIVERDKRLISMIVQKW